MQFTPQDFDEVRKQGFRPQVVGCFVNEGKILFVFKKAHELWQFPQGGINNHETLDQAFRREMTEELGATFMAGVNKEINVFYEDQMEFPSVKQGNIGLQTDAGEEVFMKGKKYFFVVVAADQTLVELVETEFDEYRWTNFNQSLALADTIYQTGKQRITIKALGLLKEDGYVS